MLSVANPVDPLGSNQTLCERKMIDPTQQIPVRTINPVVPSCEYALAQTNIVQLSTYGVKKAAEYNYKISLRMCAESYTPRTWRTHPLHICPPEPYSARETLTKECLNWIFLIASLNFSFWSEKHGSAERYGVEWRTGWDAESRTVHTGYWSLVAALESG
ncbi:hypothetical protein JVU11DRAFT_3494 [Chiua virens]|nr:hypothetical protein JVU11DRAFT_3494 [Chiua virens]